MKVELQINKNMLVQEAQILMENRPVGSLAAPGEAVKDTTSAFGGAAKSAVDNQNGPSRVHAIPDGLSPEIDSDASDFMGD